MIKRQNGYVLKKIKGTAYLIPYGQNIADQKRGLIFNETGEVIWNFLDKEKTLEEIIEAVAAYYEIPVSDREELGKDVEEFVSQLLEMGILKEELKKGKEPFYHCMKIGGICIKLCGPADIFPKQFASFFCEEEEADQIIEVKVLVPANKPNGNVLIRNKEMSICECDEGYLVLFHQMKNILEGYMTKDGSYVRIHALMPQNEEEKDNLFHAIRLFYLYLAQKKGFYAIHSASILYQSRRSASMKEKAFRELHMELCWNIVKGGKKMDYINAFWVGGLICALAQILLDRTKMMPGRVMVSLVVLGCILGFVQIFKPLQEYAGAGVSVPLLGFGNTLWNGVKEAVDKEGFIGIFLGGFKASAAGISGALIFGYIASWIFEPKMKG